jgi:hypothetical protein
MPCTVEVLAREPVKHVWRMDGTAAHVGWSNAPGARIENSAWQATRTADETPVVFGTCAPSAAVSTRDVCFWRMRLSGTNCTTRSRIALHCVSDDGVTNTVSTRVGVPVNDQWYTHVFFVGRELNWRGRPCGMALVPATDPHVQIELEEVRLATPPLPPVRE